MDLSVQDFDEVGIHLADEIMQVGRFSQADSTSIRSARQFFLFQLHQAQVCAGSASLATLPSSENLHHLGS